MIYFPEPTSPDESWPGWDETAVEWFRRSTQPRAQAVREFLNRSLEHFPPKHAISLAKRLNRNWQSFFFEIVVGRYLQVLGAEVLPEPLGSNGTHVDYRATFPDGIVVSVECVSKRFNLEAQKTIQRHDKMARMLDDVGPTNWAIELHKLPKADSPVEFQPYVEAAREWYATLPKPVVGGPRPTFGFEAGSDRMELEAIPFPKGTKPNHLGPAVAWRDDSIERLKDALIDSHKRRQARGAVPPVFLAIDCPVSGPDAEDLDQALFGLTVDHRGLDWRESIGTSFNTDPVESSCTVHLELETESYRSQVPAVVGSLIIRPPDHAPSLEFLINRGSEREQLGSGGCDKFCATRLHSLILAKTSPSTCTRYGAHRPVLGPAHRDAGDFGRPSCWLLTDLAPLPLDRKQ